MKKEDRKSIPPPDIKPTNAAALKAAAPAPGALRRVQDSRGLRVRSRFSGRDACAGRGAEGQAERRQESWCEGANRR